MALISVEAREIHCKVVYYGPGLSGKTSNLQYIHSQIPPAPRGELLLIATEVVMQYNKRDLPTSLPVAALERTPSPL